MSRTCSSYELSVKPKSSHYHNDMNSVKILLNEDNPEMSIIPKMLEVFPSWKWRRPFHKIVMLKALREMLQDHKAYKAMLVRGKQQISPSDNVGHIETINNFYDHREVDTVDIWWMLIKEDREYYITALQGFLRSIDPQNAWRMNDTFSICLQYLDDSVPMKKYVTFLKVSGFLFRNLLLDISSTTELMVDFCGILYHLV